MIKTFLYDGSEDGDGGDIDEDVKNVYLQSLWEDYELTRVKFQEFFEKDFPSMLPYEKLLLVADT